MAVVNYEFQVINAGGVGVAGIVFGTTVGSSPGIKSIDKLPSTIGGSLSAITTPTISFLEKSDGIYIVQFDAEAQNADVLLVLDAASGLTGANRYIPVALNRDSSRILQALPAAAPNTNGGIATLGETGALLDVTDIAAIWAAATRTLTALPNVTVGGYATGQDVATALATAGLTLARMRMVDASVNSGTISGNTMIQTSSDGHTLTTVFDNINNPTTWTTVLA